MPPAERVATPLESGAKEGKILVPGLGQLAADFLFPFAKEIRIRPAVGFQLVQPFQFGELSPRGHFGERFFDLGRDVKIGFEGPSEILLGCFDFFWAERRAMGLEGVLFMRAAVTDVGSDHDKRGTMGLLFRV